MSSYTYRRYPYRRPCELDGKATRRPVVIVGGSDHKVGTEPDTIRCSPGAVSPEVREHLLRDIGPAEAASGGDLLLMMPHLRSLARAVEAPAGRPELQIVA